MPIVAIRLGVAGLLALAMSAVWALGTTVAASGYDGPTFTYDDSGHVLSDYLVRDAAARTPDGTEGAEVIPRLGSIRVSSRFSARELVAPRSPHIDPGDVANRTPQQIDDLADDAGLIPRGPDPKAGRGAYTDPVTGEQRILCHSGACPPHAHVNDPAGNRLDINGNIVSPESPAAHLPLSTDASP